MRNQDLNGREIPFGIRRYPLQKQIGEVACSPFDCLPQACQQRRLGSPGAAVNLLEIEIECVRERESEAPLVLVVARNLRKHGQKRRPHHL